MMRLEVGTVGGWYGGKACEKYKAMQQSSLPPLEMIMDVKERDIDVK